MKNTRQEDSTSPLECKKFTSVKLESQDINALFDEMGKTLASHGSAIIFTQLRVSAERFVVPLCGLAVERTLRTLGPSQFHVRFEKMLPQFKKVMPQDYKRVLAAKKKAQADSQSQPENAQMQGVLADG